jgi:hypothetical protein
MNINVTFSGSIGGKEGISDVPNEAWIGARCTI